MVREAWLAAVHADVKNGTQLNDWTAATNSVCEHRKYVSCSYPGVKQFHSILLDFIIMVIMETTVEISCQLLLRASLVAQVVKNLPSMLGAWVQSLGPEEPWRREWQPTSVYLPGEFHRRRSLADYSPWGRKESDRSEWLSLTHSYISHYISQQTHAVITCCYYFTYQETGI